MDDGSADLEYQSKQPKDNKDPDNGPQHLYRLLHDELVLTHLLMINHVLMLTFPKIHFLKQKRKFSKNSLY